MSLITFSCLVIHSPDSPQTLTLDPSKSYFHLIANIIFVRDSTTRLNNYNSQLAIVSLRHIS